MAKVLFLFIFVGKLRVGQEEQRFFLDFIFVGQTAVLTLKLLSPILPAVVT